MSLLVLLCVFFLLSKLSGESESKQHSYHQLSSLHSHDYILRRPLKNTNYPLPACLSHFINFIDVFVQKNGTKQTFPAKAIKEYIYIDIDSSTRFSSVES